MMDESHAKVITFDSPAVYRIWVGGKLENEWTDRLEGMSLRWLAANDAHTVTILEGKLADQAALAGVLMTLYNGRVPLLAVKRLSPSSRLDSA